MPTLKDFDKSNSAKKDPWQYIDFQRAHAYAFNLLNFPVWKYDPLHQYMETRYFLQLSLMFISPDFLCAHK